MLLLQELVGGGDHLLLSQSEASDLPARSCRRAAGAPPPVSLHRECADLYLYLFLYLYFLYTGSAQISEILIADFLVLAEDLGIDGLANSSGKDIFNEVPVLAEETEARKPKIEKTEDLDKDSSKGGMLNLKAEEDRLTRNWAERKHNSRVLKVCHTCNKTFNDASNFRRHIKKCPFGLPRASTDVIKIPKRSADGFYHCQYCDKKVKDSSNIRRHIRNRHTVQMGQATST